jgi:dipeptidyl aminopeptidase/acylaminoacyl peptidase
MPDLRSRLERIGERVPVPEPAFDRLVVRRERKRRRERLVAGAVAVVVFAAVVVGFVVAEHLASTPEPMIPPGTVTNGLIVFSVNRDPTLGGHAAHLFVMREGGHPRPVVKDGAPVAGTCPTFSPDGSRLAYRDLNHIAVSSIAETGDLVGELNTFSAPDIDGCPSWSPDGRTLAWVTSDQAHGHLTFASVAAGGVDGMSDELPTGRFITPGLAWSPDGTEVAVGVSQQILLAAVPIGTPTPVELPPGGVLTPTETSRRAISIAWSPDGSRIAFGARSGVISGFDASYLGIYDLSSGGSSRLADGTPCCRTVLPAWSPDGKRIAYTSGSKILLVAPDGSHRTDVTGRVTPVSTSPLQWSPDGTRLLLVGRIGGANGLVSVGADGSSPTLLTPSTWDQRLGGFAADGVDWQAVTDER